MKFSKIFLILFLLFPWDGNCFSEKKIKEFEKFSETIIRKLKIPGVAIAIVSPNKVLYQKVYGIKKLDNEDKITNTTNFRVGSLSKCFSSLLIYKLIKKGKISLEDLVKKYIPDLQMGDRDYINKLKIKHILSHTSGVESYFLEWQAYDQKPSKDLFENLREAKNICQPGMKFHYQNVIFSLISEITERATGKSFIELMKTEILDPLGMDQTYLTEKEFDDCLDKAFPHERIKTKHKLRLNNSSYYYNILPAAGVTTCIKDITKFLQYILLNIDNISRDTNNNIFHPFVSANQKLKKWKCKNQECIICPRKISWRLWNGLVH